MNLPIEMSKLAPLHDALLCAGYPLLLPLEERWYRIDSCEAGNRQYIAADPDGYLLRFFEDLGEMPLQATEG